MYYLQITGLFQFTCRLAAETESRFTSVERMDHYARCLEHEGPFEKGNAPANWPSDGRIEFVDVKASKMSINYFLCERVQLYIDKRNEIILVFAITF